MTEVIAPVAKQAALFDPVHLEQLSHPRTNGFFALLFPRSHAATHTDVASIQGTIFPYLTPEETPALLSVPDSPVSVLAELTKNRAAGVKRTPLAQWSFGLQHLETVIGMCQGRPEHYISQADFKRPNRLSVNLLRTSSIWLDLDIYKSPLSHIAHDESMVLSLLRAHCLRHDIPLPSVIMRSGRGYYAKWLTEALPAQAFPRVRACMAYLCRRFAVFGADTSATDASRVLRVGGSTHSRSEKPVRFIWKNDLAEYRFDALANAILPVARTPEQAERWKQGRDVQKKIDQRARENETFYDRLPHDPRKGPMASMASMAFQPGSRQQSLWWSRTLDLRKLVELRGEALEHREVVMFMMMNALAWSGQATPATFWNSAQDIAATMPRQGSMDDPRDTLSTMYRRTVAALNGQTVEHQGQQVSALYRYKNATLIERLCITSDEMPHLLTIIDSAEVRRRNTVAHQEVRRAAGAPLASERQAQAESRRQLAVQMRQQGLSWAAVGEKMGIKAGAARMLAERSGKLL